MAYEVLAWPGPPTFLDLEDGGQAYNLGIRFQVTESLPCAGVEWNPVPATVSAPPLGSHVASLWDGDGNRLAAAAFVPTPGLEQRVLFDAAVTLLPGVDYIAAVYTIHYVFRPSGGVWPTSFSGRVIADTGRLAAYSGGPDNPAAAPSGNSTGLFYVGPLVGSDESPPEDHTTTGTAAAVLAATAGASTARITTGAGAATAAATAARTTRRLTVGSGQLAADGRATVTTARRTAAAGRLLLSARSAQVRGGSGGGPRLVSSTHGGVLASASRPDVITTSTRG